MYRVRHLTAYSYDTPVASATLALRVTPRDSAEQRTIAHKVDVSPAPALVEFERDFFGNAVNVVTIEEAHTELSINATADVEVSYGVPPAGPGTVWEEVADLALHGHDMSPQAPAHFMFASPRIQLSSDVTRYAQQSFKPGRGIIEAARDLMTRIKREFVYKPESTEIWTPLQQAFAARRGVCQDFAHIMIAGLRGLGVPAAYVSGYLRTVPPPGKERLEGADATHAWVSVWCGPEHGWLGFDPTNAIDTGNDHITLAIGRDFSDVSPVYGVFVGSGANELQVEVDVIPLPHGKAA
jgi:transglutaminase-like putative cysteine protease